MNAKLNPVTFELPDELMAELTITARAKEWKIKNAEHFFKALQDLPELKEQGIQIHYQTKINGESLAQLISSMK